VKKRGGERQSSVANGKHFLKKNSEKLLQETCLNFKCKPSLSPQKTTNEVFPRGNSHHRLHFSFFFVLFETKKFTATPRKKY